MGRWLIQNDQVLWWLAVSSVVVFFGTLMLIPWVIVKIPADFFAREMGRRSALRERHPILISLVTIIRNIIAALLICVGILLLVLPGQGLLTIFMGMVIASFPGRRRLINSLAGRPGILRRLNWIRHKAHKEPLQSPSRRYSR